MAAGKLTKVTTTKTTRPAGGRSKSKSYKKYNKKMAIIRPIAKPKVYSFVRCIESSLDLFELMDANGFMTYVPNFKLSDLPEYSNYETLFRQGRLAGVRNEFIIQNNTALNKNAGDPTLTGVNQQLEMRCYPKLAATTLPTTMLQACNIRQAKTYNLVTDRTKPLKIYAPCFVTDTLAAGTGAWQDSGRRIKYPFVPLEAGNPQNLIAWNLAYAIQNTGKIKPPEGTVVVIRHYLYAQFKGQTF